jgi:2-oxoglutarate dehydrogenase E2 component (dihydrolipoamide succinyltransferase)
VPAVGESITEVDIGAWLKAEGEPVQKDEPVVTLETDKATVELLAPEAGVLSRRLKDKGSTAAIGEVIGLVQSGSTGSGAASAKAGPPTEAGTTTDQTPGTTVESKLPPRITPAALRVLAEHGLRAEQVRPTGPGGRLLKEDALREAERQQAATADRPSPPAPARPAPEPVPAGGAALPAGGEEAVVPMSRLRRTIAQRLVEAQQQTAMLTTFNEVDMSAVSALRKEWGEAFQQRYHVKLGLLSFFLKAAIDALKQHPVLNAEIRGTDIVFHNYYDLGIAVSTERGLVVPVLRHAERLSFAETEQAIGDFARRARENKLKLEELRGGTFTITNGGVFGSLLSTPFLNPPQSGILGLHAIQDRPVAREGAVVVRPMMYVALTYDHRIVDGREAVSFLRRIKEAVENPARMLIEV